MKSVILLMFIWFSTAASLMEQKQKPSSLPFNEDRKHIIFSLACDNDVQGLKKYFQRFRPDIIAAILNEPYQGLPMLHHLVARSTVDKKTISFFLVNGADPNRAIAKKINLKSEKTNLGIYHEGYTTAHVSIRARRKLSVLYLLKKYDTDFNRKDKDDWTPLMVAIKDEYIPGKLFCEKFKNDKEPEVILSPSECTQAELSDEQNKKLIKELEKISQRIAEIERSRQENQELLQTSLEKLLVKSRDRENEFLISMYFYFAAGCVYYTAAIFGFL